MKLNEERNVSLSCRGGAGQAGSCSTHPCMIWSRWMLRAGALGGISARGTVGTCECLAVPAHTSPAVG